MDIVEPDPDLDSYAEPPAKIDGGLLILIILALATGVTYLLR